MPFVYNHSEQPERGCKRRKLSVPFDMARGSWQEPEHEEDGKKKSASPRKQDEEVAPMEPTVISPVNFQTSNRDELIQSIKRGERPKWVPKPTLEALSATLQCGQPSPTLLSLEHENLVATQPMGKTRNHTDSLPPSTEPIADPIERPRSALHAGDFREQPARVGDIPLHSRGHEEASTLLLGGSSMSPPWIPSTPFAILNKSKSDLPSQGSGTEVVRRSRAPSLGSSLSSSFVLRVPTSPLVHAINNTSLDFSTRDGITQLSASRDLVNRRRTLPPEVFQTLDTSTLDYRPTNFSRPLPEAQLRRESSLPHQIHQSRRSLNSFTYQPTSSPQSPTFLRSRRPSYSSDTSPIQHAAMVGSFEESILRGRMSTAPSKPLDFVAQIGVLGKGNCKPSLLCPAHVTIPFPAVFYNYPAMKGSRSTADDTPSPYVGNIDLEHNLKPVEQVTSRKRRTHASQDPEEHMAELAGPENTAIGRALAREAQQLEKQPVSSKSPLGGCYRVPQQGQLQIVIKNPNKTAVKLFLVPYDLDGMELGTKTFVRQRSFSAGPIIEKPLSGNSQANLPADPLKDKHILRYLIHLKFCCPSKGRFYLYDNIRVVFANRVPDGKEKLRNEVQLPEPKYSPYRAGRTPSIGAVNTKIAAEKTARRRSSGFGMSAQLYDAIEGFRLDSPETTDKMPPLPSSPPPFNVVPESKSVLAMNERGQAANEVYQIAIHDAAFQYPDNSAADSQISTLERTLSPVSGFQASMSARGSPVAWNQGSGMSTLRKFSSATIEPGDGLLSRKLREYKEPSTPEGGESS